jgi:hypothetical protein
MQQFKLSRLALLKNDEHAQLIEQVCRILDDHPVDDGHVRRVTARVKSHQKALKGIKCQSRKHALTPVLSELAEKRRRTLISLKMRVKAAWWSPLSEENEPARVLKFWLDKQGKRLMNGSCMARTRRVNEMLQDAVDDASLREALTALRLMPLVDCLRETNEAFSAAFMQRNEERAREEKADSRAVRKAADKDVKLLMKVLLVQAEMEGESRYGELMGELGKLFAYYWKAVAVRKGRRTAAKAKNGAQTPPAIDDMKKGRRIAAAAKEANNRPANTTERKERHAAVEAEGKKNTESITAVDQVPATAHPVRATTPQKNLTPPEIIGIRKSGGATATPHKNTALPARNIGFGSDRQHSG